MEIDVFHLGLYKNDSILFSIEEFWQDETYHEDSTEKSTDCWVQTRNNPTGEFGLIQDDNFVENTWIQNGVTSTEPYGNSYHDYGLYATIEIENIDITFTNAEFIGEGATNITSTGTQCSFMFGLPLNDSSTGWGGRKFRLATSVTNVFEEESALKESNKSIGVDENDISIINIGECPDVSVFLGKNQFENKYVSKTKYYMRDSETDIFYLQFYIDHKTKRLYSTTSGKYTSHQYLPDSGTYRWILGRENLKEFNEVNSYESETMVSQDDALSNQTLTCRYKASVVANSRMYVGNILQNGRIY